MMNVRFSAWAALLIMEPASTSATNTWRIDQPPVSPEIGTRRRECVATLKPSLTGRHRFHAITNGVLAGIGPICLGHESHTAGLNCAGGARTGKPFRERRLARCRGATIGRRSAPLTSAPTLPILRRHVR